MENRKISAAASVVPILMYHEVLESRPANKYTISAEDMVNHFQAIRASGKVGRGLHQVCSEEGGSPVGITFDDGYRSDVDTALPILKEFGYTATFFITTDWIGKREEGTTWKLLEKLLANNMDIQAHGHTHRFLDSLNTGDMEDELALPQRKILAELGHKVTRLALPGGRYSSKTIQLAKHLGYESVSTSIPGCNIIKSNELSYLLKRYTIHQGLSSDNFLKIVRADKSYSRKARTAYEVKKQIKSVIGNEAYQNLWNMVKK